MVGGGYDLASGEEQRAEGGEQRAGSREQGAEGVVSSE